MRDKAVYEPNEQLINLARLLVENPTPLQSPTQVRQLMRALLSAHEAALAEGDSEPQWVREYESKALERLRSEVQPEMDRRCWRPLPLNVRSMVSRGWKYEQVWECISCGHHALPEREGHYPGCF